MDDSDDSEEKTETVPLLFGTGNVNLKDTDGDEEDAAEKGEHSKYGTAAAAAATTTTTTADPNRQSASPPLEPVVQTVPAPPPRPPPPPSTNKSEKTKAPKKQNDLPMVEEKKAVQLQKEAVAVLQQPHRPNQNPCLWFFHFLNGSAVVISSCIILTQILPLLHRTKSDFRSLFSILNLFLKFYIVLFCILFILVETDTPIPVLRNSALLQAFSSRGFLYSFLGLISTVEAYSNEVEMYLAGGITHSPSQGGIAWSGIFMQVSAWLMLGVGAMYMLLGLCCMKHVRDRMEQQEQEAWRTYRHEMKEWKRRMEMYGPPH